MTQVVRSADGKQWTVWTEYEWRSQSTADDFEHDISAARGPGIVMLLLVVLLTVVLIVWTPPDVNPPLWLILMILLVALFFPVRWALRRPYTIRAVVGDDGEGNPTEKWVGTVRGVFKIRPEFSRICNNIRLESTPGLEGPLKPVG